MEIGHGMHALFNCASVLVVHCTKHVKNPVLLPLPTHEGTNTGHVGGHLVVCHLHIPIGNTAGDHGLNNPSHTLVLCEVSDKRNPVDHIDSKMGEAIHLVKE